MKSQRGITLASLAIYIVLIFIVLGILAVVRSNFQSGVKEINDEGTEISEINNFNMYFLQEVKKQGNKVFNINSDNKEISFITGITFKYNATDKIIYMQESSNVSIKIANNIANCKFDELLENGKKIIRVTIKTENSEEKTIDYVLNSEEITSTYEDEKEYVHNSVITSQTENNS